MAGSKLQPGQFVVDPTSVPFANDALSAPLLYAEDIKGVIIINGMAKLTLVETRANPLTEELVSVPVATLVVPLHMIRNWGPFLTQHIGEAEKMMSGGGGDAEA